MAWSGSRVPRLPTAAGWRPPGHHPDSISRPSLERPAAMATFMLFTAPAMSTGTGTWHRPSYAPEGITRSRPEWCAGRPPSPPAPAAPPACWPAALREVVALLRL